MNKLIRTGLLMLLAVSLMLTTALAGEVIISEREKASRLADKAMEEKYGITLLTQEYFNRNTADEGNGRFVVQYWGIEDWGFVLGNYKVVVDNGKVTEITWSHDGEDTSGGMNADAWGQEQILEMLLAEIRQAVVVEVQEAVAAGHPPPDLLKEDRLAAPTHAADDNHQSIVQQTFGESPFHGIFTAQKYLLVFNDVSEYLFHTFSSIICNLAAKIHIYFYSE